MVAGLALTGRLEVKAAADDRSQRRLDSPAATLTWSSGPSATRGALWSSLFLGTANTFPPTWTQVVMRGTVSEMARGKSGRRTRGKGYKEEGRTMSTQEHREGKGKSGIRDGAGLSSSY